MPSRLTVRPSKAITSSAGAGLRRAVGRRPGGNWAWTLMAVLAGAAAVVAGATVAAGPPPGAALQAPAANTSKASRADRIRMTSDPTWLPGDF